MSFLPANIYDITEKDLQSLIENGVSECKIIEYKQKLNFTVEGKFHKDEKNEFLADISSFANTSGGDIIYGIKEEKGLPIEIIGISGLIFEKLELKLHAILRSHIEPRISGIKIYDVKLKDSKIAIIIRNSKKLGFPTHE